MVSNFFFAETKTSSTNSALERRVTTVVKLCSPNMIRVDSCVFLISTTRNQTKRGEIDFFRTISKVLVYVFCSKRIVFRAILRNTLGTPLVTLLAHSRVTKKVACSKSNCFHDSRNIGNLFLSFFFHSRRETDQMHKFEPETKTSCTSMTYLS